MIAFFHLNYGSKRRNLLNPMKITLDLNKSLEENASNYFEKAKKLKKKLKGAENILSEMTKKMGKEQRKEDGREKKEEKAPVRKKLWYERFRWFMSSEGFLVIGGRDATSNEIIIKKHAERDDIVFHTDMAGSPFFVVKSEKKKIGQDTLNEAANATCSFSRAWKLGLTTTDVFHVSPEQVSKEARSGEYLSKGSFVIKGKTTYINNEMDVAVGIYEGAVMAGPKAAVMSHCPTYFTITQGSDKPSAIAKKIRQKIGGDLDETIRALPSGGMKIEKYNEK